MVVVKPIDKLFFIIESWRSKIKINPYLASIFFIGIALVLNFFLNAFLKKDTYLLLVIAIFLSAWYGGFKPGIAATILGFLVADYYFIEPKYAILQTPAEYVRAIIFLIEGILFSLLSESRNRLAKEKNEAYLAEQKARQLAEDFVSMASHELKLPITSQKAYIQLLQILTLKNKDQEYGKYLSSIEVQTNRLTNLINNLLDLAKIQAGKFELNYSTFNIRDCINTVVEELRVSGVAHKIIIRGGIRNVIYGDRERISQVLTNLLSNAIKYSPEAKKVLVVIKEDKKNLTITIKDYGIGMSQEDQKKLFTKYFRVEGASEKDFKGFGMGLYIVSEIIKQHQGKISVKSARGKGSIFIISLPVHKKP